MNPNPKLTVYGVAEYFGLQIELVDDLPDNVYGQLDSRLEPNYVVVRRGLPQCEESFTIAHELGHYALHSPFRPQREPSIAFTRHNWKSPTVAKLAKLTRRCSRRRMTPEWQADLWALCLLFYLGDSATLNAYIKLHPEKSKLFLLAAFVSFYQSVPQILSGLCRRLLNSFRHT